MEIIIGLALIPVVALVAFLVWSVADGARKRSRGDGEGRPTRDDTRAAERRSGLMGDTAAPPVDR